MEQKCTSILNCITFKTIFSIISEVTKCPFNGTRHTSFNRKIGNFVTATN